MSSYVNQRLAEIASTPGLVTNRPLPTYHARREVTRGYVYFVKMGAAVKIGFSTDVGSRLKTLRTASPGEVILVKVHDGTPATEKAFHDRFKQCRGKGEWFRLEGDLAAFLDGSVSVPVPPAMPKKKNFFDGLFAL